jgi:uncharacterized protein YkwD
MGMNRRSFVGAVLAGAVPASGSPEGPRLVEQQVFAAVNRHRRSRRRPELSWSDALASEARRHSARMQRHRFFGHHDPIRGSPSDRLRAAGIRYTAFAENLYSHSGPPDAAPAAVAAWLGSRGHRANLLSGVYRETGIGVSVDSSGRYAITQIFLA